MNHKSKAMKMNEVCKACSIRGYSSEICALHHKYMADCESGQRTNWLASESKQLKVGKMVALGACAGVMTSALGVSAACLIGLKGLCETILAAKVVAGGGVAGALANVALKSEKGAPKKATKRKSFIPPFVFMHEAVDD